MPHADRLAGARKAAETFVFKRNWIPGALGGKGVEMTAGKVTVVYAASERALGRGGRDLASLHEAVKDALGRAAKVLKWQPQALCVGFADRHKRLAYAWHPGASSSGMRIICLSTRVARGATRESLTFITTHELAHHWREEARGADAGRSRPHDKTFCDGLRAAAGDLGKVGPRCASSVPVYDPALDAGAPAKAPLGVLKVKVRPRGWSALWVPAGPARPPTAVPDARALARLARSIDRDRWREVPVTYEGPARGSFPRPARLDDFMRSIAAMARVARERRAAGR